MAVNGTLNDPSDTDRGWTVELALPWAGLASIADGDGRSLPPRPGDTWRMDFFSSTPAGRTFRPATRAGGRGARTASGDSHIPELFATVEFSAEQV